MCVQLCEGGHPNWTESLCDSHDGIDEFWLRATDRSAARFAGPDGFRVCIQH